MLTSPPAYHPTKADKSHGLPSPTRDLDEYGSWVADILVRCHPGVTVVIKTDVRYKGGVLPVGVTLMQAMVSASLPLAAHWMFQRLRGWSPYAPSMSHVFVMGRPKQETLRHCGLFVSAGNARNSSAVPDLFEQLLTQLTAPGDEVLDPFVGEGSAFVAAKRTGRWCTGVELDEAVFRRTLEHL